MGKYRLQYILKNITSSSDLPIMPNEEMSNSICSGIYAIINKNSGLIYIGLTHNFRKRKIAHLYGLRNNKHRNKWLQEDYNKEGVDAFIFIIVEKVKRELLNEREQFYMDLCEYKYNVILFSDRRTFTKEHRKNLSIAHIGNKHTEEAKLKISAASKGNKYRSGIKLSEEHKKIFVAALNNRQIKVGPDNPLYGRRRPKEVMAKVVKTRKEKYGNSCPGNYKPIAQYDKDGRFIKNWGSIKEASNTLAIGHSKISEVCNGKRKRTAGFIFKFIANENTF